MGLEEYQEKWHTLSSGRDILKNQLKRDAKKRDTFEQLSMNSEKALIVVQDVAKETQQRLEFRINKLVTTALAAVFPDPPEFKARFTIRRNQTECDLLFVENGTEQKPSDSSGGGTIDVASFALRIARWSLNKNRSTLILDEPFRNVSPDLQHKVSEMVRMLSDKIGLQIIMVSHASEVDKAADTVFFVDKIGGISNVRKRGKNG